MKSPIKDLFDALCQHETLTVQFPSIRDMTSAKIRLHQLRKETDAQLSILGDTEGIFGNRAICFEATGEEGCYKISLSDRNAPKRAAFTILSLGETTQ